MSGVPTPGLMPPGEQLVPSLGGILESGSLLDSCPGRHVRAPRTRHTVLVQGEMVAS